MVQTMNAIQRDLHRSSSTAEQGHKLIEHFRQNNNESMIYKNMKLPIKIKKNRNLS